MGSGATFVVEDSTAAVASPVISEASAVVVSVAPVDSFLGVSEVEELLASSSSGVLGVVDPELTVCSLEESIGGGESEQRARYSPRALSVPGLFRVVRELPKNVPELEGTKFS